MDTDGKMPRLIVLTAKAVYSALKAGEEILGVYNSDDFDVTEKDDKSPLTLADRKSHTVIETVLKEAFPDIPFLSEEGRAVAYEERSRWSRFWLVDPLDGTKEFIKRNGEFTVNVALIDHSPVEEAGRPLLGVIFVPVKDVLYFGSIDEGAYRLDECGKRSELFDRLNEHSTLEAAYEDLLESAHKLPIPSTEQHAPGKRPRTAGTPTETRLFRVVASRSHFSPETEAFIEEAKKKLDADEELATVQAGSSLKFCLVAEGKADVYPRFGPTMEWDTGAGQAIVEAAGGIVVVAEQQGDGDNTSSALTPLRYNKPDLRNPWFLVQPGDYDYGAD